MIKKILKRSPPTPDDRPKSMKLPKANRRLIITMGSIAAGVLVIVGIIGWYGWALGPLDASDTNKVRVEIQPGEQPAAIARQLKDAHIIRSSIAFQVYARLNGSENKLQYGHFAFSPAQTAGEIIADLASGKTDQFSITILPGQTLKDITTMLESHGYNESEIDAALNASYPQAIFATKPASGSLEGFFYPDTYNVLSDESLVTIFGRIFDHYSDVLQQNNIVAGFSAHGLTPYQGLTLASIVQREVPSADDQAKVASVFYNRLAADMALGSDVTYIYGASLLGAQPTPKLNSPYNTRIVKGLPPTPISNPGLSALKAAAYPASTNYLFFVSGDDNVTYFATTDAQHEANIAAHCKVKCAQ